MCIFIHLSKETFLQRSEKLTGILPSLRALHNTITHPQYRLIPRPSPPHSPEVGGGRDEHEADHAHGGHGTAQRRQVADPHAVGRRARDEAGELGGGEGRAHTRMLIE